MRGLTRGVSATRTRAAGARRARRCAPPALALAGALTLSGCGLVSGSPMTDSLRPGKIGKGKPLKGAELTVTSKEFTEQIVLGQIMGIAFKAAGAEVVDRTSIQGSIGAREAVRSGTADGMYEYTGTSWITYLGHTKPIVDPHKQWEAVRDEDAREGLTWLPPSSLDNTYAIAVNEQVQKKYDVHTLSDMAKLEKEDPSAVTVCSENEFASREDGLRGMARAYGMKIPSSQVSKMSGGVVYTQTAAGTSCNFGEVFMTDGRIKALDLKLLEDDRKFFPNYNAAPEINTATLKRYPQIREVLAPVTKKLDNDVAQELNARVDVDGEDPHTVALDWMKEEGFIG
ncbi:glycine betaine ABC transporter substrate-binding protein [Streptomyces sulphureus]|uniref:glycine betaine ABC transporter substrate-binding protein n=1 Tax=Streptomyces sulphureus TaxID=47758 RepID=UPI00037C9894|nr:glycine betaine ABC transporter substrate-binding protein [Streptomyces sulphureus]